jgi:hypothetical protein
MRVRALALTLGFFLGLAGLGVHERASAQDARANTDVDTGRSHFKAGVDYYRDGDLTTALIEFKRAYASAPNYRVLYNLGQVSNEMRDYVEAQRYFQRYLTEGAGEVDGARKQEVENYLVKIAGRIATIVLSANLEGADLYVDDVLVGKSPMGEPVRVSAGTRRLSAAISGRTRVTQVTEAAGGDTLVVKLEFAPPSKNDQDVAQYAAPGATAPAPGIQPAVWLGIASGALAVGTGVMGFLAYSDSSSYQDKLTHKTTATELQSLHDGAKTKALVTDILLGATVVSTAITVYVALQGRHPDQAPSAGNDRAKVPAARTEVSLGAGSVGLTSHF